jgi:YVTN family beta-propeller protein
MRLKPTRWGSLGLLALGVLWAAPAQAVTATVSLREPSLAGAEATFEVTVSDAVGPVLVRWLLGDDTQTDFVEGATTYTHTYAAPGHYSVIWSVRDDAQTIGGSFVHTVHLPLTEGRSSESSDLVYDAAAGKVYSANYDNDSVSVIDTASMAKVGEVPVSRGPISLALAPGGKLWVLHRDAYSLSIIDTTTLSVEKEVPLPYASQPMGLAISPTGDFAYVTLMATGKLLSLLPETAEVVGEADVGGSARGVSVSHDGSQIYVTRFISQDTHGEVVRFDNRLIETTRFELGIDSTTMDTDQQGRGLPNYLFSVALSPDGVWGWVPGKKDNILRGPFRDDDDLSDDNTVRPLVALLNVADGTEHVERRIDLDDRNLPNQVVFTPLGNYAFVSLAGTAAIDVRDAYTGGFVTAIKETGFAPRGMVLTEDNKLFVHASLSRSVVVYDVAEIVSSYSQTATRLTEIPTVESEKLDAQVLRGKQLFFNSSDTRMSDQGYLSCASCHFDGAEDGRVWDFGSVGEGLRNSVSLLGRRGTAQGNVNWSGSFDEIQDADDNIRTLFGGKGFLSEEQLAVGTVGSPLGDKKAGLSPELDAMAAYMDSLDEYHQSPYRNPDGTLTADGVAGRVIFKRLGCGFCHTGADSTDSSRGKLHDVGTLKPTSGARGGQPLLGIDTPTLNGVWETAPYLHDGSAATLRDVLTTQNAEDRHAFTSELSPQELDQLVSYVQQLDGTIDPSDEPVPMGGSGAGGSSGGGGAGVPTGGNTASAGKSGGCTLGGVPSSDSRAEWLLLALAGAFLARARRRA